MGQHEKNIRQQFMNMPVLVHVAVMITILVLLIIVTMQILKGYTRHNEAVIIPDVKGLSVVDAAVFFENNGLRFSVVDSVYSKEYEPGAIVEMVPTVGSKVKEGRIVFITINANSVQKAAIPDVVDLSYRQALALVQSKGFTSVEIKHISGRYKDLTMGIELKGKQLTPGELVPLSAKLSLIVNDGSLSSEPDMEDDSVVSTTETVVSETEEWF